jgi:enolase
MSKVQTVDEIKKERDEALRLLRATWEALPSIISEDEAHETDWDALEELAEPVRVALREPKLVFTNVTRLAIPDGVRARSADEPEAPASVEEGK